MNNGLRTVRRRSPSQKYLSPYTGNLFLDGGGVSVTGDIQPTTLNIDQFKLGQRMGATEASVSNNIMQNSLKGTKSGLLGNLSGAKNALIGAGAGLVGGFANNAISGGLSSKAGSAISNIGGTLGGAIGMVNPVAGAIVGLGSQLIGGLTNRMFGMSVDQEKLNKVNANIDSLNSFTSNANSFDDVKGPQAVNMDTNVYEGGWFTSDDADEENKKLRKKLINAKQFAYRSVDNNINNLVDNQRNTALRGYYAFGGPLFNTDIDMNGAIGYNFMSEYLADKKQQTEQKGQTNMFAGVPSSMFAFGGHTQTHGGIWDSGLTHIDAGGTHEENPNDGVQMGVDSQGVPNLVEENEVVIGDYVLSNRLKVPRGRRGNYGKRNKYAKGGKMEKDKQNEDVSYEEQVLKPFEGLTFAEAAKRIEKQSGVSERPNDPIAQRGFNAVLNVLIAQQEKEREKQRLQEMQEAIDKMSPEEFAMLQQQMEAQQAAQQQQEMAMQQQQMIPQGMEQMQPVKQQQPIAALGGLLDSWKVNNTYATGGDIDNSNTVNASQEVNMFEDGGFKDWWEKYITTPVIKSRVSSPNYGALYTAFTGKDDLKDSGDVYNALQQLYETNPEKFTAYDLANNTFIDSENAEPVIEETITPEETIASSNEEEISKEEVKGPEVAAFNYYNSKHSDKSLTAEQWNALGEKEKGRYIKQYKSTLGKDDKIDFDESLTAYNKQQELNDKVAKYQKQQRESTLTADDIKDLSYEDKVRLAKYMNPDYQAQDLSKLSLNEKDKAKKALDEQLVQMSKDKGITLDNLSKNFAAPQYHRDWKPVDAEQAWQENTTGYDWQNPLYGGEHDVVGSTEGKYQPRSWVNDEGKVVINDGDNTYTYDDLKAYELSDEYLKPRYELAKSAAAQDEAGQKIWNDYVNGLSQDYTASYIPTTVFGEKYADNLRSYADFKNYITSNYDALNQAGSGFFDQKAGQMHGMMLPTTSRQRELYQVKGNEGTYLTPEGNWQDYYTDSVTNDNKGTILHTLTPRGGIAFTRVNGTPEDIEVKPDGTYTIKGKGGEDENPFPKPSNWPFGLAAALQLGSLGYNILKPADYSNADALLSASKNAGIYKPVEFRPIGNYLTYRPLDIWYEQNRLNANARATDRAIMNSGVNQGAKNAALLASGYNNQIALGNLYRQALEYNDALRKQVEEFNRGTDMFNSEGFLKRDMANQDAASRAAGYNLEGQRAAYAMRQAVDDAKANAISAGMSGLANLAYNYGTTKDQNNLLRWLGKSGANGPIDMSKYRANGGRIRRKKGLSI